ncbi:L-dopachrome tautomerase-related protein [Methylomonas sp. EFPC3]|uniref:L-dopachrome tautomerase-related protein n=1 Tax=Methylomonas sp. EFPC3 TaxID=3021710 RepID=UPI00241782B4|nr:L-dopachrome tautomerase-related protein [Methylomonas sp. EFPC3]WFP49889.1 L-dopachrome tautomerase-related protein [Methylomonas sp. EFPC3]
MNRLTLSCAVLLILAFEASADSRANFDVLANLDTGPGNVTATANGRIIMSQHQFYQPQYTVVEYQDQALLPFPNREMSAADSTASIKLDSVLGIRSDANGIVWMLDNGMRSGVTPKLVGWNSKTNKLQRLIYLPAPIAPKDAFVNDFALDAQHNHAFISDPAGGANAALIVVNLSTGAARRVLEGHKSVVPENVDLVIDNVPIQVKTPSGELVKPHIGVNPITEDLANEWVYFGPMHGLGLYRIKAADLINESLTAQELAQHVERYSDKPISDGISIDENNNIYLGDLANNAIGVIEPNRQYRQLAQCPRLSWVDSFSFGANGQLYAVVNRLHRSATLNGGDNQSKSPYFLLKVKALAAGLPGR